MAAVHLVKLSVGTRDVAHLTELQRRWRPILAPAHGEARAAHVTRHRPKRAAELLDGGSLYWVIQGVIRVRQRLIGFEDAADGQGLPATRIVLDATPILVAATPMRPFQGWRYLAPERAPPDLPEGAEPRSTEAPPAAMAAELRALGLL